MDPHRSRPTSIRRARRRPWPVVLVAALALLVAAGCGGDDDAPSDAADTTSTTAAAGGESDDDEAAADTTDAAEGPVVRLVGITYQGNPAYTFEYEDDGTPIGFTRHHPVTGDPLAEYRVVSVDDDGNITEFAVEDLEDGTLATEEVTYDDAGRVTSQRFSSDAEDSTVTYTYDGATVVVSGSGSGTTYTLDDDGNIATSVAELGEADPATTTYLEFDDVPEPRTLTGGLLVQIYSTNNATRWSPDAGCEYVEDMTYEDGLLVESHAEGCGFTHDYTYTYAEF